MEEQGNVWRKKGITRVGWRFGVYAIAVQALQFVSLFLLRIFAPEFMEAHITELSFLLVILTTYFIGGLLVYLLNRRLPQRKPTQDSLGAGAFMKGALYCGGICFGGLLLGVLCNTVLENVLGLQASSTETLNRLMYESGAFLRILTVGILAPIFEELIFRKILVDSLLPYGKWVAVAASGILFGLFHGNFSQCFFAMGLGFFFAYTYIRTGRIRYSILYHMGINLTTSVFTVFFTARAMNAMEMIESGDAAAVILPELLMLLGWMAYLFVFGLSGFILLCLNLHKFTLPLEDGEPAFGKSLGAVFGSAGMWLFLAVCVLEFVMAYAPG